VTCSATPAVRMRSFPAETPGRMMTVARFVIRLAADEYVHWSSVVDAPVSYVHTRRQAVAAWTEDRVARADRQVSSIIDPPFYGTAEQAVAGNRAGPDETTLTLDEIRRQYHPGHDLPEGR
jgi:hypothetical protein